MYRPQQQSTDRQGRSGIFCGSEKAAHHTSSVSLWLRSSSMFCPSAKWAILRAVPGGLMYRMKNHLLAALGCALGLGLPGQAVIAASAPPLSEVKVLKVESPACGFEDIVQGQAQTRSNHRGPNIKVYLLEI